MGLMIKFLLKNILEKKMRTLLIVFSIALSAALFFASLAISDTALNIYINQVQSSFGRSELVIQANEESPSTYFTINIPTGLSDRVAYMIGVTEANAVYRHQKDDFINFEARGMTWEDIQLMSPITLKETTSVLPFSGNKVIISSYAAKKYALKTGSVLELDIHQHRYRFTIVGIAEASGLFTGGDHLLLIPKDKLSSICFRIGNVSKLYVKLKNPEDTQAFAQELTPYIQRYDIRETLSEQEFRERTGPLSGALNITLIILIFLSAFIIYTSFKVITAERLPVIGTFRSIGADKKTTGLLLLSESCVYGIGGGLAGCVFGVGILYLAAMAVATEGPGREAATVTITFNLVQMGIALLSAIILSLTSSALPIIRVSKLPVKEVILNTIQQKEATFKTWRLVTGLIMIAAVILIPPRVDGELGLLLDTLCIGLAIAAAILLVPFITTRLVVVFDNLLYKVFGTTGSIAVKNLRSNKNMLNSIVLLTVGIATVMLCSTIGKSAVIGITDWVSGSLNYQLELILPDMDRTIVPMARATNGVVDVYGTHILREVEVIGYSDRINQLEGVDSKFATFKKVQSATPGKDMARLLSELNFGRNIIITTLLRDRYQLRKGSTLTLKLNNKARDYTVIGFIDSMESDGSYALIASRYFIADTKKAYYSELAIKTSNDPDLVLQALQTKFNRSTPSIRTMAEFRDLILSEVSGIVVILNVFSSLVALIGLFGMINNLIINFIERKKSLAILRSLGASRQQTIQIVITEALTGGIIGGIAGLATGFLMISIIPHFFRVMIATIPANYSPFFFIITGTAGVIVALLASIAPALKTSKLNIIQSIKYE